jgi:CHASE1-domain containing sensor protein
MLFMTLDIEDVLLTNRDRLTDLLFIAFSLLVSFIISVFAYDLDSATSRTTFENELIETLEIIEIIV